MLCISKTGKVGGGGIPAEGGSAYSVQDYLPEVTLVYGKSQKFKNYP
jgi:hypothetical protein